MVTSLSTEMDTPHALGLCSASSSGSASLRLSAKLRTRLSYLPPAARMSTVLLPDLACRTRTSCRRSPDT